MDKQLLTQEAVGWRNQFYKGQRLWSVVHHTCLFGSIICSVAAGALLQIYKDNAKIWSTILTTIAAVLTAIAASGGFDRKWRSNRLSRSCMDVLLIDLEGDNPNLDSIRDSLKDVIKKHDLEIVAEKSINSDAA